MSACLAICCFAIGAPLTFYWRRHRAELAAARESGAYVRGFDAKGVWLFLNGPVTVALGVIFTLLSFAPQP